MVATQLAAQMVGSFGWRVVDLVRRRLPRPDRRREPRGRRSWPTIAASRAWRTSSTAQKERGGGAGGEPGRPFGANQGARGTRELVREEILDVIQTRSQPGTEVNHHPTHRMAAVDSIRGHSNSFGDRRRAERPSGSFRGAFSGLKAVELGGTRSGPRSAGRDRGRTGRLRDRGPRLQAGAGQITSLQASIGGGLPRTSRRSTINKVCLSGMAAIAMADQMIRVGEIEVAVAAAWIR